MYGDLSDSSARAALLDVKDDVDLEDVGSKAEMVLRFTSRFEIWWTLYDQYVQPGIDRALKEAGQDGTPALTLLAMDDLPVTEGQSTKGREGAEDDRARLGKRKAGGGTSKTVKRSRRGAKAASASAIGAFEVNLPSTYACAVIEHADMQAAVRVERLLREGQANDALDDVRAHLITTYTVK